MARAKLRQEIVEARYPVYDADTKALIAKVYAAHKGSADVEERLIDVVWEEHRASFRSRIIEASRGDPTSLVAAKRGELTPAGRAVILAYLDEARDYDDSLLELSDIDLAARHDEICGAAQAAWQSKRRERGLQADVLAFFNRPNATADIAHWGALLVWSAEEATALSFGKDPRRVNVASLRQYKCLHGSPYRDEFLARLDMVERAIKAGDLREPLTPAVFMKWSIRRKIELHTSLATLIGSDIAAPCGIDVEIPIHNNRLHTYYKIILGLAVRHYSLDVTLKPTDMQLEVYSAIAKDLLSKKAKVDEKTLRKIVREALTWAQDSQQPLVQHAAKQKDARAGGRLRLDQGK